MVKQDDTAVAAKTGEHSSKDVPEVSIIILNFNGKSHLEICLPSLMGLEYPKERLEIIVADNASEDGSADWLRQKYPNVRLLVNSSNLGFAAGINGGAEIAKGKYVAFLNPDMRVDKKWLSALVETLNSQENVACSGSIVLNWNGDKIDYAGRPNDALNLCPEVPADAQPVLESANDCSLLFASGGAMLIDRKVFLALGGFDRDYFMYHEDVDLGWRLWIKGHRVLRSSKSVAYHRGGASSKRLSPELVYRMAQKYILYTLVKNLEDAHLWPMLSGVLWFLVERSRWFEAAGLSLGDAVQNFIEDIETVLLKRASIQSQRVLTDSKIFAACEHPLGFMLQNHKYHEFTRYLSEKKIDPNPSHLDSQSLSLHVASLFAHAQRFASEEASSQIPSSPHGVINQRLSKLEKCAIKIMPLSLRGHLSPFWRHVKNKLIEKQDDKKFIYGQCNVCGKGSRFFYQGSNSQRESLNCEHCNTSSRYRSISRGLLRAISELTGLEAHSLTSLPYASGIKLRIYDTQLPFYAELCAYPLPDMLKATDWIDVHLSQYRPKEPVGKTLLPGITNQNLECLTFSDGSFDVVITSDVMEHVRLDQRAHQEIYRVLKPGGIYIFTVPHSRAREETLTHVQIIDPDDVSKDMLLLEPVYHGDANSDNGNGALVYRIYGRDIDASLTELGFNVEYFCEDVEQHGIRNTELFYCRKAPAQVSGEERGNNCSNGKKRTRILQ